MTADVELLPCPWCGGKIEGNVSEGSTFRWRKVDGCCADGPEVRHNTTAPDQGIAEHESRIAAIKAWNTRAATAAQAAEIEALRAEIGRWRALADTGTAESFLALSDDDKRKWFAMALRESSERKQAEARAEQLAEALREIEQHALARGNGGLLQFVRAALHPTAAQEGE